MKYINIDIHWLGHDGFMIKGEKTIFIDPIQLSENITDKADILLITHTHGDHVSIEDIKKIVKKDTIIIGPADFLSQSRQIGDFDIKVAEPGKNLEVKGIKIEAVAAYNTNKSFHPKDENWMGYIVEMDEVRVYHAGDTDLIPEMKNIKCDVAILPVSGKFTMTSDEAVHAAEIIKPNLAIPMHWGSIIGTQDDAEKFALGCRRIGINAEVLEKE